MTAGLNGLNWQVQVWPWTLAIVSEPPCLCVALSVLLASRAPVPLPLSADVDVDVVDPLHPAASRLADMHHGGDHNATRLHRGPLIRGRLIVRKLDFHSTGGKGLFAGRWYDAPGGRTRGG